MEEIERERELKRLNCKVRVPVHELRVESEKLYKELITPYGSKSKLVLLRPQYIPKTLFLAHSSPTAGHGGAKVTLNRCSKFAFRPGIRKDVEHYCRNCSICCRFKTIRNTHPAPLRRYPDMSAPFERLHMDLVGSMGVSSRGNQYIMTIIYVFT